MRVLNLPNQITLARLVLAIIFFSLLSQYAHRAPKLWLLEICIILFVVAAGTDFLDGYIARKYGQVTALGRVLDPLVDKVLVCGTFVLFVGPGFVDASGVNVTGIKAWMVIVIVGRELLVTGLRGFSESTGQAFGASVYGKLKMWMQSIAAPAILLLIVGEGRWIASAVADTIKTGLVWATVIITVASSLQYLFRARHLLDESAPL